MPIVVVFTKYDKLVDHQAEALAEEEPEMSDREIEDLSVKRAAAEFDVHCFSKVKQVRLDLSCVNVSSPSIYTFSIYGCII